MADAVRLDQWLWAARFFRTRALAKAAIEAGHVRSQGERCKVAKDVRAGLALSIRRGVEEFEIVVAAVSAQRAGAPQAQLLYTETADGAVRREQRRLEARAAGSESGEGRPGKKDRRQRLRLKRARE